MWWAGSKPYDVYLGTRAFAVCRGVEVQHVQAVAGQHAGIEALGAWLSKGQPRRRLRVWLSGGLCRPFIVREVPGVSGEAEWQRVAEAMAPAQCGWDGPCRVWLEKNGRRGDVRMAVAMEQQCLQPLLQCVQQAAGRHRVAAIRPWWSEALRAALQREPALSALAVQDCDALTVLTGAGNCFETVMVITPVVDAASADAALARWQLTAEVSQSQPLMNARLLLEQPQMASAAGAMALDALTRWSR